MHRLISPVFIIAVLVCGSAAAGPLPRIIFDTDLGGDADDLGALAMLHNMMTAGECELIAVMNWNTERHALPAIVALNEFYGHPDVPGGTRKAGEWQADWQYSEAVVDVLDAPDGVEAPDATSLYRALLGGADDGSITIIAVGPLANILALIESGPDAHSELSGRELIRRKVSSFVVMGGRFPSGDHEWNFDGGMAGVTKKVFEAIDVPVIFSGFEVGDVIRPGEAFSALDPTHPLHAGYLHFSQHAPWMKDRFTGAILDNASFDQTAVLYAVRGGLGDWWTLSEPGYVVPDADGGNVWKPDPDGNHRYLILKADPDNVARVIRNAMLGTRASD